MSSKVRLGDLDFDRDDDYLPGEQTPRHKMKTKTKRKKQNEQDYTAQRENKRRSQDNYI